MSEYTGPTAPNNEDDVDDLLRKIARSGASGGQVRQMSGAPTNSSILTANGVIFTLVAGEIGFIQNLDDAALAVKKGTGASATSFSFILAAGSAASDGTGGATKIDDWIGPVSVFAMTGAASYIAWKQSAT